MDELNQERLKRAAQWLLENQDKRGTPEWETIAEFYKQARAEQQGLSMYERAGATARAIADAPAQDRRLAMPGAVPEDTGSSWLGSMARGFAGRATELGANLLQARSKLPFTSEEAAQRMQADAGKLRGVSEGLYAGAERQPFDWQEFRENPLKLAQFAVETGIVSAPDMFLAMFPPTILPYLVSRTEEIATERAKSEGIEEPGFKEYAIALPAALANLGLERFGGSGILRASAKSALGRIGTSMLKEGVEEAAEEGIEYLAETLGTERGSTLQELIDRAAAGAIGGVGLAGATRGAIETGKAVAAVPGKVAEVRAALEYSQNPEQVKSDLRIAELIRKRRAELEAFESGHKITDDVVLKDVAKTLKTNLTNTAVALYKAGDIDKAARDTLKSIIDSAGKHNYEIGTAEVATIEEMDIAPEIKQVFLDNLRDLNEVTYSSYKKNLEGPLTRVADKMAGTIGGSMGAGVGATIGGWGGATAGSTLGSRAARAVLPAVARKVDTALGLAEPPIVHRAEARLKALEGKVDPGDALSSLKQIFNEARSREKLVLPRRAKPDEELAPIDRIMREKGVERLGGWMHEIQQHANAVLPAHQQITQQDIVDAVKELYDLGAITESDRAQLLGDRTGIITDDRVYYGLQDWVVHRAKQKGSPDPLAEEAGAPYTAADIAPTAIEQAKARTYLEELDATAQFDPNAPAQTAVDPEGREIAAKFIAGDKGLSSEDLMKLAKAVTREVNIGPPGLYGEGVAGLFATIGGLKGRLYVDKTLPPGRAERALAHETGHAIDALSNASTEAQAALAFERIRGKPRPDFKVIIDELVQNSVKRRPELWPDVRASGQRVDPSEWKPEWKPTNVTPQRLAQYRMQADELMADAIAAYLQDPVAFKEAHPNLAKYVRDVTRGTRVSEYIGFASIIGLVTLAMGAPPQEEEEEPRGILAGLSA